MYNHGTGSNWGMTTKEREELARNMGIVWSAFDPDALKRTCEAEEISFAHDYDMDYYKVPDRKADDFYLFRDNGSSVLFVAHLDTVVWDDERGTSFAETEAGLVVHSGALDDRLGAYVGLELLPKIGLRHDWLLTVGEEHGRSTAEYFTSEKPYDWIIEFDRGGTDVVMYAFEDEECASRVRRSGAKVGNGIFSDICYLEHLEVKGFNWGVGYQDYHCTRGFAFLEDTVEMVAKYLKFHATNVGIEMYHEPTPKWPSLSAVGGQSGSGAWWNDEEHAAQWDAYVEAERKKDAEAKALPAGPSASDDNDPRMQAWTYDEAGNRVEVEGGWVDDETWELPGDSDSANEERYPGYAEDAAEVDELLGH